MVDNITLIGVLISGNARDLTLQGAWKAAKPTPLAHVMANLAPFTRQTLKVSAASRSSVMVPLPMGT
jgi:hypothetical protein